MAFVELLPALLEPLAEVPDTWRGRLPDGTPVSVRRHPEVGPDQRPRAIARLRGVAAVRQAGLLAPLGAAASAEDLSVSYPADLGIGLESARQALGPAAGLLVAEDALQALAALHAAGQAHGAIEERALRVFPGGEVRLWAPAPLPPEEPGARDADVRATAQLVCRAVGLPLEWTPSDPVRDAERAAPALAATLRALARGSLDLDAAGAAGALREASGGLADEESVAAGRAELDRLAGGPAPRPARAAAAAPAAHRYTPAALAPLEPHGRRLLVPRAVAGAALLLIGVGALSFKLASRPTTTDGTARPPAASPAGSPSPSPAPSPSEAPPSAGDVHSVSEQAQGACATGASCTVEVTVFFAKATTPETVSWQFQLVDGCTGDATYVDGNHIQAQAGWNHVIGDTRLELPAGHPLSVVAVTVTPSRAASSPLLVSGGTC